MRVKQELSEFLHEGLIEAGCDEAGRGPLAGPVFAAAVILPKDFHHPLLNDSKKMTEKARETLRPIIEKEAIAWAVEMVSAEEIDTINILNASITGMQRAVRRLTVKPRSSQRHTGTNTCVSSRRNIRSTAGNATWDTRQRSM